MSEANEAQYGVFPVVPRANDVDKPIWTDKELDKIPYEFKPADKSEDKSEDKKEEGDESAKEGSAGTTTKTPAAPAAPAPSGNPAPPKA